MPTKIDIVLTVLVLLSLLFSAAWLTLLMHETAHCVIVWLGHGEVTSFKPYPHKRPDGKWTIGYMEYMQYIKTPSFYWIIPLRAGVMTAGWCALAWFLYWPLLTFAVTDTIDHMDFWLDYARKCETQDGGKLWRMWHPHN